MVMIIREHLALRIVILGGGEGPAVSVALAFNV